MASTEYNDEMFIKLILGAEAHELIFQHGRKATGDLDFETALMGYVAILEANSHHATGIRFNRTATLHPSSTCVRSVASVARLRRTCLLVSM